MLKHIKGKFFSVILTVCTVVAFLLLALFAKNFSSVFFVLIGGGIGVVVYLISLICKKNKEKGDSK